jgi:hypothetical protein
MRPSVVVNDDRQLIRELVHRFRVDNPHVFGSTAASLDHAGSDLDLLVDALPGATLFDLGLLHEELEARLGLSVDLVTPGDLSSRVRVQVLAAAKPL